MVISIELIGLVLVLIWLSIITALFLRLSAHYNKLIQHSRGQSLQALLDILLKEIGSTKKDIAHLADRCVKIEKDELLHIQKIGLLRFNPFKDTGGDQSFIVALVDANDTGIVISGLYSRSGTRWYAKKVIEGKGDEHELSEEEKKALRLAKSTS